MTQEAKVQQRCFWKHHAVGKICLASLADMFWSSFLHGKLLFDSFWSQQDGCPMEEEVAPWIALLQPFPQFPSLGKAKAIRWTKGANTGKDDRGRRGIENRRYFALHHIKMSFSWNEQDWLKYILTKMLSKWIVSVACRPLTPRGNCHSYSCSRRKERGEIGPMDSSNQINIIKVYCRPIFKI